MPEGYALVFDIETVPDPVLWERRAENTPEFAAPGNYKDPTVIQQFIDRKKLEWQLDICKEMSLSPLLGNVICVGWWQFNLLTGEPITPDPQTAVFPMTEAGMCNLFWQQALSSSLFVTFNGKGFDVPFLEIRSRMNGIIPPVNLSTKPYENYEGHIDLMALLGRNSMSLDSIRRWYHIHTESLALGKDVFGLHQAGKHAEIAAHCRDDVRATAELAKLLHFL